MIFTHRPRVSLTQFTFCGWHHYQLDESTARRQLKSPRSLSGRSIHLTLAPNGHGHEWPTATPFVQYQSALPIWDTAISKFDHENPWSRSCVWSKVKVTLTFKIQRSRLWSRSNPLVTFEAWSSIDMFAFVSWQSDHFWLRYSKFYIWPWKFKVKVMAKVKPDGHIWAIEFNQYACFLFRGNQTIFGWDIANSIFDLENSRSRSWPRSNPMATFEP